MFLCGVVWWGILLLLPPRRGGGWGRCGWWGGMTGRGGMVLKGGCRDADPPVCVLVSPFCLCGGRVEWRVWWCCVMPRLVGSGALHCSTPLCVVLFLLHHPALQCVCCHSVVGLGVCLCGGVVSLWNGGDGLWVGWNGGACGGVYPLFGVWCALQYDGVYCSHVIVL